MRLLGKVLTDMGWRLRSGGAKGPDSAFYLGCKDSELFYVNTPKVYLSWNGMRGGESGDESLYHNPEEGLYDAQRFPTWEEAQKIALRLRPGFHGLGRGGIAHMTRNVFQVLSEDLNQPAGFLVCWAEPTRKDDVTPSVKGGTGQAVRLAVEKGVRIVNLYHVKDYNEVIGFFDRHQIEHPFQKRTT